jgi:CheY-like chemotaxis protein
VSERERDRAVVLVADNEDDILALVRYMLEREGFDVVTADNGRTALELAEERQPDIALLDVRMPELDGYEVVREIRRNSRTAEMPVIMLSASVKSTDVDRSIEAGANDHLAKPFSPDALARCVRRNLEPWAQGE